MIGSETSYTACRNILDVKEGNARHHHLKARAVRDIGKRFRAAERSRMRSLLFASQAPRDRQSVSVCTYEVLFIVLPTYVRRFG